MSVDVSSLQRRPSTDSYTVAQPRSVATNVKSETRVFFSSVPAKILNEVVFRKAFGKYGVKSVTCNTVKSYVIVEFNEKVRH